MDAAVVHGWRHFFAKADGSSIFLEPDLQARDSVGGGITTDERYAFVQNTLLNPPGMSDGSVTVVNLQKQEVVKSMDKDAGFNPNCIGPAAGLVQRRRPLKDHKTHGFGAWRGKANSSPSAASQARSIRCSLCSASSE